VIAPDGPWAPLLGLLPPELGRSLGPWLDKLALAIGPLRARARTGSGVPDGFEGLSLRGPYDRLVLSEWALADALPEEFIRRAAQGEHAFYQLARREEAKAKTSVALFDPGPMQLGGPRIGQFAALLVLARRAREAGASFAWATLQQPPEKGDAKAGLHLGLDAPGLRSFLVGRTAFAPTQADIEAWFERARRADWEDLWVIGPPATLSPGRRISGVKTPVGRIELSDVFEPGARALDLTVVRGAHRRSLRLDLPPEPECLQLLRGGVAPPTKPVTPVPLARTPGVARPVSPPILLADGRKVAFVDAGDSVTVYTVPDTPSPKRGRYLRYALERGNHPIALAWTRRRLVIVSERGGTLHVHDTHGDVFPSSASVRPFDDPSAWQPSTRPALLARAEVLSVSDPFPSRPPTLAFLDGASRLIGLSPERAEVLASGPIAPLKAFATACVPLRLLIDRFARSAAATSGPPLPMPVGDTVLGFAVATRPAPRLGLLTLAADRRTFHHVTGASVNRLFVVDSPVRYATASPRGDRVALVSDDGTLEVWSLPAAQCLLRVVTPT
jgi:hypothetical protein